MKRHKSIFIICCLIFFASILPTSARILRYYPNQLEWIIVWLNSQYAVTSSILSMRFYPTLDDNILLRTDYWNEAYSEEYVDRLMEWAYSEALEDMRFRGLSFRITKEKRRTSKEKFNNPEVSIKKQTRTQPLLPKE